MRSALIVVAGLVIGWLPITALPGALPQSAIPHSGESLRLALTDGMSRAGATIASAESAPDVRH
jgi:hypothetical protein